MFTHPLWKDIKEIPGFSDLYEFYEGMRHSIDEGDFDADVDFGKVSLAINYGNRPLTIPNHVEILFYKKDRLNINFSINIEYGKSRIINIYLKSNKRVLYDDIEIGRIEIYSSNNEIQKIDYESGREIGKEFISAVSSFKDGLGKEIFDSITLYFLSKEENPNVYSIKYEIYRDMNYLQLQIENREKTLFSYDVTDRDIKYLTYFEGTKDSFRVEITQDLLNQLRDGSFDSTVETSQDLLNKLKDIDFDFIDD